MNDNLTTNASNEAKNPNFLVAAVSGSSSTIQEEICDCNVGITNVFHKGKCIKCKKKVVKTKPYYWQVK